MEQKQKLISIGFLVQKKTTGQKSNDNINSDKNGWTATSLRSS